MRCRFIRFMRRNVDGYFVDFLLTRLFGIGSLQLAYNENRS